MKKILFTLAIIVSLLFVACSSTEPNTDPDSVIGTEFTITELSQYNGKDGNPAYVAIDGIVYDVSDSSSWSTGSHNGGEAGTDVSELWASSPHDNSMLKTLPIVGTLKE